jgi:membrane protease YdiL (CAAX protease family)
MNRQRIIGRRKEDQKVQEQIRRHDQLFKVGQLITSETNLDILFEVIMDQTNHVMETERSTVFLHDKETRQLWSLAATGVRGDVIQIPSDHGVAGWVFQNKTPLVINDPYHDARFYPEVDRKLGYHTRNILSIPLINRNGECIGTLQALNKVSGEFKEEDAELLTFISHYVTIALENSKLVEELKKKRRELERELKTRAEFGYIFISIVLMISFYTFFTVILKHFHLTEDLKTLADSISHVLEGIFILASILIVLRSRLPLSDFGLNLHRGKQALIESSLVSLLIMIGFVLSKAVLLEKTSLFQEESLMSLNSVDLSYATYLFIAPLQEFITRGVFQGTIQRLMVGRFNWLWAVLLTSFLFGMFHIHESIVLGLTSISLSTLWGLMYVRHRTIVGISLSHFLIGNWAGLTGFWSLLTVF